jgi:hypothetical protein
LPRRDAATAALPHRVGPDPHLAYCARFGTYATEEELKAAGFISKFSEFHNISVSGSGPC